MKLLLIFLFATTATLAQNPVWSKKYHKNTLTNVAISNDGSKIVTGTYEDGIILWDITQGDSITKYKNVQPWIHTLEFAPNNSWFLSYESDYNNNIYLRKTFISNSIDNIILPDFKMELPTPEPSYYLQPPNMTLAYFKNDSIMMCFLRSMVFVAQNTSKSLVNIALYNIHTGKRDSLISTFYGSFHSVIPSKTRNLFYYFHNYNQANIIGKVSKEIQNAGSIAAFSANDSIVIMAQGSSIDTYSTSGEYLQNVKSLGLPATSLGVDFKNRYYISAHADSTLCLWTPGIRNIFKSLKIDDYVIGIAMSPDSTHFATIHKEGTVAYWNIDSIAKYAVSDSIFIPTITAISGNQTVCEGAGVVFTASAKSNFGEKLFYQWQKGGVDLQPSDSAVGVNSPALILKDVNVIDAGTYSVKVTSTSKPQSTSASANLTVQTTPVLKTPIARGYINVGTFLMIFHAGLIDSLNAQFQWFRNGVEIPGATKSQYYFNMLDSLKNAGEYYVQIINPCGKITSNSLFVANTVSVEENPFKNIQLSVEPNPFKNSTTIHFSLPKPLKIKLAVTDILGKEIAVLKDEWTESGEQSVVFKNENLPDGMYYITLSGEGLLKTIPVQISR